MRWRIRKCPNCKTYTLKEICPKCGNKTIVPHPPRFSPEDKYVEYRLLSKYPDLLSKGVKISKEGLSNSSNK
ncbi:MAG: RNA-protein complex protein Nop10 [Ignisphaera sp.]